MSAPTRIVGFGVGLAVVFALAAFAGSRIDPSVDESTEGHEESEEMNGHASTSHAETALPGLAVAQDGYRLVAEQSRFDADPAATLRFRIVDESGAAVRDFDVEHERRMHLIVVRRDFQHFQHLHPEHLGDGTWVAELDLRAGGVYRAFADFATAGRSLTLATDLFVGGRFDPQPLAAPASIADAGDGYEVRLDVESPTAGEMAETRFVVSRNGRELDGVEPYLGADGHLVALREHDQAFLHTHPEGTPGGPGPITFAVSYPTAGRYRLFLQFQHGGEVRTAEFTQEVVERAGH